MDKILSEKFIKIISLLAVILTVILVFISTNFLPDENFKFSSLSLNGNNKIVNVEIKNNLPKIIENKNINILFFGDLMLDRHVGEKIKEKGLNYIFENLENSGIFNNHDLISANLEGAVTNKGVHYPPNMSYDFAFSPELIKELKKYHFNFFNISNNHLSDQGEKGIKETSINLSEIGYNFSGCRDAKVDDCSSTIVDIKNKRIALVGLSQVYASLDEKKIKNTIKNLKEISDIIIVNIHWGVEYNHKFNKKQQQLSHILVDNGADIVIGHHPHVVQGMEIYNGKPIFYSLGNFVFDQYFSQDTQEGLALNIDIIDNKKEISFIPLQSSFAQVSITGSEEKEIFLKKYLKWSEVDNNLAEEIKSGKIILN